MSQIINNETTLCTTIPIGSVLAPLPPVNQNLDVELAGDDVKHPLEILDVTDKVFVQCLFSEDLRSIQTLVCLTKRIYENIQFSQGKTYLVDTTDLQKRFPDLRILDTNVLPQLQVNEKFHINLFALVKGLKELPPHIEGDAGVSLLILRKGTTLKMMDDYAKSGQTEEEKMEINFYPKEILTELGDDAVEETCVALITNNIFNNSCNITYLKQCDLVRDEHQCELPPALGYLGLIVLTQKLYHQCLFGQIPLLTFGRSSTSFKDFPLVVGGSSTRGYVNVCYSFPDANNTHGAAGLRKV